MLSYRHGFHAGNHADIFKHTTLSLILENLQKKEKPFTIIDTHSGAALYNLEDNMSQKTQEAEMGIIKLIQKIKDSEYPQSMKPYLNLVNNFFTNKQYPGSPAIEKHYLRSQDVLILSELHNTEIINLQTNITIEKDKHISIFHQNGFQTLEGLTPPKTKRGLAFIDPSYELDEDYQLVVESICKVHQKWTNGIIALWYPLLQNKMPEIEEMKFRITDFVKNRKNSTNPEVLVKEFIITDKPKERGLFGSGMLIINPCWHLDQQLTEICDFLKILNQD